MDKICARYGLLENHNGIIRIPFFVKGRPVYPPDIDRKTILEAFDEAGATATCVQLPHAQVVREPVIDRVSMTYTDDYIYQIMPAVNAADLIETNTDQLVNGLYSLSVDEILDYLDTVTTTLWQNHTTVQRVLEVYRLTSEYPDAFLDGWSGHISTVINRETGQRMIDDELSFQGKPGRAFLNGWVKVSTGNAPDWLNEHSGRIFGTDKVRSDRENACFIRAMPTRQLHITAGNAPEVPLISALRAILTKSAAVIKLPYGAILPGILFGLAACAGMPDHPITRNLSLIYWPGGSEDIEHTLFTSNAFDRIVVWGSPDTMVSVKSRTLYAKTVFLNPRYGVSLIGRETFPGSIDEASVKASLDVMAYNQRACISSLVHYVEGNRVQTDRYAAALCSCLSAWDDTITNFIPPFSAGSIERMRRGRYATAEWHVNRKDGRFSSGVVVLPGEFDILDHPMRRLVVVRPVTNLEQALGYLHTGVSTAGVFPEARRVELRDRILARGVSSVPPLGQAGRYFAGMPHDGMRILSELVDWKNG